MKLINTREHILHAAQELLAKYGYSGFSLGLLCEHMEISKGVLTYHFAQKDILFSELVQTYFGDAAEYMAKHMVITETAPKALESYISTNLHFVSDNAIRTMAMIQIIGNHRNKAGELVFSGTDNHVYQPLIEIFLYGQMEEKNFRIFAPALMAMFVRSAIDAVSNRIVNNEIQDMDETIEETVRTFILATRRDGHEENTQ
ncbi:hypothetical protein SY83_06120 [Paenibacillus swuensis]|uniref:HTH tetR-type domain-containing protein n=1 Tax=Paenibacillus swuensis TaxID=1178515 RepID=A0A172TGD0_9BACL|nr:TetR/AcrR family transcriptional regulator [Paenibacillus swuensis]ANE45937.1 hypothetical protein SY83_06120 [Paenibacillus swuensis]